MPAASRSTRVFISSTFKDMQAEVSRLCRKMFIYNMLRHLAVVVHWPFPMPSSFSRVAVRRE